MVMMAMVVMEMVVMMMVVTVIGRVIGVMAMVALTQQQAVSQCLCLHQSSDSKNLIKKNQPSLKNFQSDRSCGLGSHSCASLCPGDERGAVRVDRGNKGNALSSGL